jgi:hypothetical protein
MRQLVAFGRPFFALVLLSLAGAPPALAGPAGSRGQQLLPITQEECLRRGTSALQAAGYSLWATAGNGPWGDKGPHTAVIFCEPGQGAEVVDIFVATEGTTNAEVPGAERVRLQELMAGSPSSPTGELVAQGRYVSIARSGGGYAVRWKDLPSYPGGQNWVAVVPASNADDSYGGTWTYMDDPGGKLDVPPLPAGDYEVRVYFNWPSAGYTVAERVRFRAP